MVKLFDIDVDEFLEECVTFDHSTLDEEFRRIPAYLAYWNERFAMAARLHLAAKLHRERVSSSLHAQMREDLMEQAERTAASKADAKGVVKVKSPTVGDIESAVLTHGDYVSARDAEVLAEVEKDRMWGVIEAIRAKRDMVIQMGANIRAEMAADPILRDHARGDRAKG